MNDAADTILAVDDEPGILKVYEDLLAPRHAPDLPRSSRGAAPQPEELNVKCSLILADSGEEAVKLVSDLYRRGGRVTACFADMRMPGGMDGLETVKRLRALDPKILVTFVTAYQDRAMTDIGAVFGSLAQDEWDFLNKPFTRSEIIQKARNMIAGWNRRRENEALMSRLTAANEELIQRAEELQAARQHLLHSEKMAVIGRISSGVAHELNNPLTSVIGYTHLALRSEDLNSQRALLERVADQANRAAGIVKNLLSFARKREPERAHLGLNGVILKSIELREYELRVANIAVRTDLCPSLPKTMFDFSQLQQVIVNLLTNAEQALGGSGRAGVIRVTTRVRDGRIEALFSDDGPGIPETALPHIFDPFFTTKEVGKGTGLGLSICYGILAEHGGSIGASNLPGEGACFTIDLPILGPEIAPSCDAAAAAARAPGGGPSGGQAAAGLRVLFADDEPLILDFAYRALTRAGHSVVTAANGEIALLRASEEPYDLVITDLKMPRMDGIELASALQKRSPGMAGRFLFISGDIGAASAGLPPGAPHLMKPFTQEDLLRAIAAFPAPVPAG